MQSLQKWVDIHKGFVPLQHCPDCILWGHTSNSAPCCHSEGIFRKCEEVLSSPDIIKGHLPTLFEKHKQYQFCNKIKFVQLCLYNCRTSKSWCPFLTVRIITQCSLRQFFSVLQVTLKSTIMSRQWAPSNGFCLFLAFCLGFCPLDQWKISTVYIRP